MNARLSSWSAVLAGFIVLCLSPGAAADPQPPFPPTDLSYKLRVKIDPGTRQLTGQQRISWTNRSSRPIARVPVHLYLNAFSHLGTTWMQDLQRAIPGGLNMDRRLKLNSDPWGFIEPTAVQQVHESTRGEVTWRPIQPDDGNPMDRSLIELTLPRPVPPGGSLVLELHFKGRLPVPFARTGCTPTFCMVAQWFPKIGVLEGDSGRWAARQFHGMSEFYADFADYDVTIEVPQGWIVGATGQRVSGPRDKEGGTFEVRYTQRAVHDFAIVLGRDLIDRRIAHRPRGGGPEVSVRYLLPRIAAHQLGRARGAIQGALDYFGRHLGPYPYATLTVIMPPHEARATSGMEYPTLILGNTGDPLWDGFPLGGLRGMEGTLIHEFGHQYFYGLLASNEQLDGFLDEGFTSAWDTRVLESLYGRGTSAGVALGRTIDVRQARAYYLSRSRGAIREPLSKRPTELFSPGTHRQQIYIRGAQSVWTANALFGRSLMDRVFAGYYQRYRFKHPTSAQFLRIAQEVGGVGLEGLLRESFLRERVPDFEVLRLSARPYTPPRGRVTTPEGVVQVTAARPRVDLVPRIDPRADDRAGRIWIQIADPGWRRGGKGATGSEGEGATGSEGEGATGSVGWIGFTPRKKIATAAKGAPYYESRARISGPAWDHLPVTVVLSFEDGAEVRETWDGRAAWREYRVIRRARLAGVRLDPEGRVQVDVVPQNNGLLLQADRRFIADWGTWLGALIQWIAGGVSLWL